MDYKPYAAAFVLTAAIGFGTPASAAEPSAKTSDFVHKASEANLFEIESSNLAIQKTSAKDVKDFAQQMVADHTHMGDQMKKAITASGTNLTPASALEDEHQKTLDTLKAASAATFDNLYVQAQSKAHDEAVTLFDDYAQNGDDDVFKKLASDSLPMLKKHQEMVHDMNQSYMSTKK